METFTMACVSCKKNARYSFEVDRAFVAFLEVASAGASDKRRQRRFRRTVCCPHCDERFTAVLRLSESHRDRIKSVEFADASDTDE